MPSRQLSVHCAHTCTASRAQVEAFRKASVHVSSKVLANVGGTMLRFQSKGRLGNTRLTADGNTEGRALFAERWEILVYKLLYTDRAPSASKAAAVHATGELAPRPLAPGDSTVSFRTVDFR
jgi:hypothetical protein